ncbi:UPF0182 family protein [Rhabdothermincola salaria]|uniref:UPF0182 family membrane protein n=1 Tax=Rhabdothermincola salaria TaxID=2903142 RepID=UPI001E35EA06|nr:UPF0182 family protein [Rhabdothermincola salaria]MCD9625615.1 UPF0182 family protein [Rhabdothermincola salaria]
MRVPTDMPKRRRRGSGRGRVVFIAIVLVLFVLVISLRGVAGFWTDYLWFESLDLTSVFTGILGAKIALGVIFTGAFFVLCFVSLTVADKVAPDFRPQGPEDEMLHRYHSVVGRKAWLVRAGISLLFGLVAGVGVSGQWQQWLLFRNGGDFGVRDATFDTDVGFYVFKLPFYTTVVDWLFASGVVILIITLVAHYLNGGIRLQAPVQRVTPAVKGHISVILALLALVKAVDYWLERYTLTNSTGGTVDGATYTEVQAQLPAIYLLLFIALLSTGLFIYNIWRRGWVLPVIAVGLWGLVAVVAGTAYPAFIQRFVVEPEESERESAYIEQNIAATRQAFGLDGVNTEPFDYTEDLGAATEAVNENPGTIRNIRLLDPGIVLPTFVRLQSQFAAYTFQDLDVDRYPIETADGSFAETQVVIGARDLNVDNIPQQSWEGRHLIYTSGFGVTMAPANATTPEGRPSFVLENVPVEVNPPGAINVPLDQPQMFYGQNLPGYAITNTTREGPPELEEEIGEEAVPQDEDAGGGVELSSWFRKAAFAARFGDWNLMISNFVTEESRIVFQRDVAERVRTLAPFLEFDGDPYPVIHDGRVVYLFDAFTTTDRYPNSQRAEVGTLVADSTLSGTRFNYVRNSVKGVVDTYDGSVTFYVIDPDDPLAAAYQQAFPDLFADGDEFPQGLRAHWRYPEDIYKVQTNMWARYHITDPDEFYERTTAWSVAPDPGVSPGGPASQPATQLVPGQGLVRAAEARIDPYYMLLKLPGEDDESFVSLRPYVPFSEDDTRRTLTAFMVAHSDPDRYGEMQVYEMPSGTNIDGPSIVNANILADGEVSERISLLNQQGSRVLLGNMLLIPLDDSILYVRPMYVEADNTTAVPELRNVIAVFGQRVVMSDTLDEALRELFPGASPETFEDTGDPPGSDEEPAEPAPEEPDDPDTPPTTEPPSTGDETVDQLLADAATLLVEAEADLRATGDLGAYQEAVQAASELLAQAQQLLSADALPPPEPVTTTTRPPTPT